MKCLLYLLLCILTLGSSGLAADDVIIADFEGADYGGWTATGEAFGPAPAKGTLPGQMHVDGYLGKGLVNSFFNGDKTQGTLASPEFTINRRYLTFLIGGGAHEGKTCINLVIDGKIVRTATGAESEHLTWLTWDVAEFKDKQARLDIVDKESGGWGHINIDQITLTDAPQHPPIAAQALYRETYRPQFHFTSARNWLNDPNGMVYYKGQYHLFFQHNPQGTKWGNMTWGHAVSRDMIHWTQLENKFEPDEMGTMFSGSAVVDWNNTSGLQQGGEKVLVALYTAAGGTSEASKGKKFTQCLAYSTDAGKTWKKYDKNPVVGHIRAENRDPKVIWHEGTKKWVMALYLDKSDFAFYSSPDLKSWVHLHDLTVPDTGECPDFFPMKIDGEPGEERWVWTAANGNYLVGSFDGKRFTPESNKAIRMDYGRNYYAVQTFSDIPDSDGRRIQIAWMRDGRYPRMPFNQQMSIPRDLRLKRTADGLRLYNLPVKEVEWLYSSHTRVWGDVALKPGENLLEGLRGELFDIRAEIDPGKAEEFGFRVRGEPVAFNVKSKQIVTGVLGSAPLELEHGRISLRILVDRTSLEIFGNDGRVSISSCFLPPPDNMFMETFAKGGQARIRHMEIRELRSIWPTEAAAKE